MVNHIFRPSSNSHKCVIHSIWHKWLKWLNILLYGQSQRLCSKLFFNLAHSPRHHVVLDSLSKPVQEYCKIYLLSTCAVSVSKDCVIVYHIFITKWNHDNLLTLEHSCKISMYTYSTCIHSDIFSSEFHRSCEYLILKWEKSVFRLHTYLWTSEVVCICYMLSGVGFFLRKTEVWLSYIK